LVISEWGLCLFADEPEDALVHAKHNGCAWYRPEEMGRHASVETSYSFLLEDKLEALGESCVHGFAVGHWTLTQAGARNLKL